MVQMGQVSYTLVLLVTRGIVHVCGCMSGASCHKTCSASYRSVIHILYTKITCVHYFCKTTRPRDMHNSCREQTLCHMHLWGAPTTTHGTNRADEREIHTASYLLTYIGGASASPSAMLSLTSVQANMRTMYFGVLPHSPCQPLARGITVTPKPHNPCQ